MDQDPGSRPLTNANEHLESIVKDYLVGDSAPCQGGGRPEPLEEGALVATLQSAWFCPLSTAWPGVGRTSRGTTAAGCGKVSMPE